MDSNTNNIAVEFKNVKKYFIKKHGLFSKSTLKAVDDVSFSIKKGEVMAVVGESGCGKSTLAKMLCKIHKPTSGEIYVNDLNISSNMNKKQILNFRKEAQMIFQDPFGSLNPAHEINYIVGRSIKIHNPHLSKTEILNKVIDLFNIVGLTPANDFIGKHPNQLSGGQRQRIVIARALAVEPLIIVADEPTSMLDVSIGIEIMNLMIKLKEEKNLTYMYITHNLASARYVADKMVVMYAGNAVEQGYCDDIIVKPLHPYTILLLASTPEPFRKEKLQIKASEDLPDLTSPMNFCPFALRCPKSSERCEKQKPKNYKVGNREVKCFLYENATSEDEINIDISIYK